MLDGLLDLVLLIKNHLTIVSCNQAAENLFGVKLLGSKISDVIGSPEIPEAVTLTIKGRVEEPKGISLPYPIGREYELSVWHLRAYG
tara:strand:+ start:498 stop:758 length:261 start_codon:yes stop_codon:yes gene_type:complete